MSSTTSGRSTLRIGRTVPRHYTVLHYEKCGCSVKRVSATKQPHCGPRGRGKGQTSIECWRATYSVPRYVPPVGDVSTSATFANTAPASTADPPLNGDPAGLVRA